MSLKDRPVGDTALCQRCARTGATPLDVPKVGDWDGLSHHVVRDALITWPFS
jgi:hypothetical protein